MVGDYQEPQTQTKMIPPTKDQRDIGVDNPTLDASDGHLHEQDETINKDRSRQEYKDEADINYMLSRFGITQPRGAPVYGEWDDTLDLQTAIESVREAHAAYRRVPQELRNKFSSMEELLLALNNGSLVIKDNKLEEPTPPTPLTN